MSNSPGAWTTKATDAFTISLPSAEAAAACARAAADTKGWAIAENAPDRLVVKSAPGFIDLRSYSIEILLADAPGGATTLSLNGWTFGKGPGLKKAVSRALSKFRAAIEAQVH